MEINRSIIIYEVLVADEFIWIIRSLFGDEVRVLSVLARELVILGRCPPGQLALCSDEIECVDCWIQYARQR